MAMRFKAIIVFSTIALFVAPLPAQPKPAARTPDEAAALVPVIKGIDGRIQSLALRMSFAPDEPLYNLSLIIDKPDRCTLIVRDGIDETPLLLVADGHVLIYDLPGQGISLLDGQPSFVLADNGKKLNLGFGFIAGAKAPEFDRILIDLPSVIEKASKHRQLIPMGPSKFKLSGETELESRVVADIDPALPCPLTRLEIYRKGIAHPELRIGQLDINQPLPPHVVHFPDIGELSKQLNVERHEGALDRRAYAQQMAKIAMTLAYRRAIRHPEQRTIVAQKLPPAVDWDVLKQKDVQISSALKSLVGGPGAATQPTGAKE